MCPRHTNCNWTRHSTTINPAEEREGPSLTSTTAEADKVATAVTSVTTSATIVADKIFARAATTNDNVVIQDKVEQAAADPEKIEQAEASPDKVEQTEDNPDKIEQAIFGQ